MTLKLLERWVLGGPRGCPPRSQQLMCMKEALEALTASSPWCHCALQGGVVSWNQSKEFFQERRKDFLASGRKGSHCASPPCSARLASTTAPHAGWDHAVARCWTRWDERGRFIEGHCGPRYTAVMWGISKKRGRSLSCRKVLGSGTDLLTKDQESPPSSRTEKLWALPPSSRLLSNKETSWLKGKCL